MKKLFFSLCTVLSAGALAVEATPNLPPQDAVARVLLAAPNVQAASSQVSAEEANRTRLEAGQYEWNVRLGGQQRRANPGNGTEERFG